MKGLRSSAMILLALVTFAPVVSGAQDLGLETQGVDFRKVLDFALCGVSLYAAVGTGGTAYLLAAITCGKAMQEHWQG
jgi:hypothetical protein